MTTQYDPFEGQEWKGIIKGAKLDLPRFGLCEFYRYNPKTKHYEVFDKYGMKRNISQQEINTLPKGAVINP